LPQDSVLSIVKTGDGYLWVGTYEGLAHFDGVDFTVYDSVNTPEMKSNFVRALVEDRAGNLWVGVDGGGLLRGSLLSR
jgi:ligand-binding sensor domain-containing protein